MIEDQDGPSPKTPEDFDEGPSQRTPEDFDESELPSKRRPADFEEEDVPQRRRRRQRNDEPSGPFDDLPEEEPKTAVQWWQFLQDFADKLTLKRILVGLLGGILTIAGVLLYENRSVIFDASVDAMATSSTQPTAWAVSEETKQQLTSLVRTSQIVKYAAITEVDLQKNRRIPRWFFLEDPDENAIRLRAAAMLAQPVFDYDPKNTQQMVSVLNNEFSCVPYGDTSYQRSFPDLGLRMPSLCRLAIPPFYGRFAGILSFGLETIPTKGEQDSLRLEASRIAVEIYLRDVVKKPVLGNGTASKP